MAGRTIGHGRAYSKSGDSLRYEVVRPVGGPLNTALLSAEYVRWARTADLHQRQIVAGMSRDAYFRSYFACDVLKTVIQYVRVNEPATATCESASGRLLGAMTFGLLRNSDKEAFIGLLAIDPENMGHHRDYPTYRGVGTGMVAAMAWVDSGAGTMPSMRASARSSRRAGGGWTSGQTSGPSGLFSSSC